MFFNRVLVALFGIPILVYLVFFGEISTFIALELSVLIMLLEFFNMIKRDGININLKSALFVGLTMPALCYINPLKKNELSSGVITLALIVYIIKRVVNGNIKESIKNISYTLFGIMYVSLLFGHIILLKNIQHYKIELLGRGFEAGRLWVALVFVISFGSDAAAYFVGKAYGNHSLAPQISPKKTVEGFWGALAFGLILAFFISITDIFELNFLQALILCVGGSIFAQLGDLGASLFKREFKVKNSGNILMSHGGLLDRCDSVLFVGPFVYYFIKFVLYL